MNIATTKLDKQLNDYISVLNIRQKKAILTIAKTFAAGDSNDEYSDEFKAELDSRYEEYINGGKLISEEEANERIHNIIKGAAKK